MARKVTIPITDHDTEGICTVNYTVAYKRSGDISWASATYHIPPIEVTNLDDDTEYSFRITRHCCDGLTSAALELTVDTTLTSLATPANFTAAPGDLQVVLDWDAVTNAESYTLERADDDAFTTNLITLYTGSTTGYTDTDVSNGTPYYYRLKATATNYTDSTYATTNATPVAG